MTDDKIAAARAEHSAMAELIAVAEAEDAVRGTRHADLAATAETGWRRHSAAKGQVTRALRDGDAQKIADARCREREAHQEADRLAEACIDEMQTLHRASLESIDAVFTQGDRVSAADAAALGIDREPEPEAEL